MNSVEIPVFVEVTNKVGTVALDIHIKHLLNIPEIKEFVTEELYNKIKEYMGTFLLYTSGHSCKTELHIDFDRKFVEDIINKICNDDTSGDTERLRNITGSGKENYEIRCKGRLFGREYTCMDITRSSKATIDFIIGSIYEYMGQNNLLPVIDGYEKYMVVLGIKNELGCVRDKLLISESYAKYIGIEGKSSAIINLKLKKAYITSPGDWMEYV